MPKATPNVTTRFHNVPDSALADALGRADAILKAAEAEVAALKTEIKRRGLTEAAGDTFAFTATETLSGRMDTAAVKAFLGDGYTRFERAIVMTVIRVRAVNRLAVAA